jgi:ribose transport system substrate-binding protein
LKWKAKKGKGPLFEYFYRDGRNMRAKYFRTGKPILIIFIAFVLIITLSCTRGKKEEEKASSFKIGYSVFYGTNPFVIAMLQGAHDCIDDWKNRDITVELLITRGSDTDSAKQVTDCEDLFAQGIDGLLVFPGGGSKIISQPIKRLFNKNDIPVVVTDIGLADAEWISYITSDNYEGGRILAKLIAEHLPENSAVMTFDSSPNTENCMLRQMGFEETAESLGLKVLPEKILNKNLEDGRRMTEDILVAFPELGGLFHINQLTAQGSVSTTRNSESFKQVAFDIDAYSFSMIKKGQILGLVVQDPYKMGYTGMDQMLTYLTGGSPDPRITIPVKLCTLENAEEFAEDPQVLQ